MFTLNKDPTIHLVVEGIFCDFQEVNNPILELTIEEEIFQYGYSDNKIMLYLL